MPGRPPTSPIADRVARFGGIKSSYRRRHTLFGALAAAGLPSPDPLSGSIIEAMWKAGFFRLRGVLVGPWRFRPMPDCWV